MYNVQFASCIHCAQASKVYTFRVIILEVVYTLSHGIMQYSNQNK